VAVSQCPPPYDDDAKGGDVAGAGMVASVYVRN